MRMHYGWGMIVAVVLSLQGCCCPMTCSPMSCAPVGCCPQTCLTESLQDHYYEMEDWMLTQSCHLNRTMACQMQKLGNSLKPSCDCQEVVEPYDVTTSAKVRPTSGQGQRADRRSGRRCKRCKQSPCRCGHCEDCEGFEPVEQSTGLPVEEHFEHVQNPGQFAPTEYEPLPPYSEPSPLPPAPSGEPTPIYKAPPPSAPMKSTSMRGNSIRLSGTPNPARSTAVPGPDVVAPTVEKEPSPASSQSPTMPNDGWRPVTHVNKLAKLAE